MSTSDDVTEPVEAHSTPQCPSAMQIDTRPDQHESSHHLASNPHHPHPPHPVHPATRRSPIRMLNSSPPPQPGTTDPEDRTTSQPQRPTARDSKKHPPNPYKGANKVMRLVQNKKLQRILLDKPQARPRKNPDRMVLRCTGKQEFR